MRTLLLVAAVALVGCQKKEPTAEEVCYHVKGIVMKEMGDNFDEQAFEQGLTQCMTGFHGMEQSAKTPRQIALLNETRACFMTAKDHLDVQACMQFLNSSLATAN